MVDFLNDNGHPVPDWQVRYDELAETFQTGDLILQHGKFQSSTIIEVLENSVWSHVGIVVRPSDIGLDLPEIPWLYWESNDLTNLPDVVLGKPKQGPMLVDLRERLRTNDKDSVDFGMVYRELRVDRNPAMFGGLRKYIPTIHQLGFPEGPRALQDFVDGRVSNQKTDPKNCYCSELVAGSYVAMGVMTQNYVANAYSPNDFSENGTIPLLRRAQLVGQVKIDPTSLSG